MYLYMATHISEFTIESYRGLKDIRINNLGDFNILLGNNNCGKTSVLELLSTLHMPLNIQSWIRNVSYRSDIFGGNSIYSSIPQLFCIDDDIHINSFVVNFHNDSNIKIKFQYTHELVALQLQDIKNIDRFAHRIISSNIDKNRNDINYLENDLDNIIVDNIDLLHCISEVNEDKKTRSNIQDIYSFTRRIDTFTGKSMYQIIPVSFKRFGCNDINISRIIENNIHHKLLLDLIRLFDESIEDIILSEYKNNDRLEYDYMVRSNQHIKVVPLSCYGDGLKQAISIFAHMIYAKNGILLIDEFDSALHTQNMPEVVKKIIDACKLLNVQLFISTHNNEAIKMFLDGAKEDLCSTRLLRMRKLKDRTICKTFDGQEALDNIDNLGMDYRI